MILKDIERCTECSKILRKREIRHNEDCGIDRDEWLCWACEAQYADEDFGE